MVLLSLGVVLGFAFTALSQTVVKQCPHNNICYSVNVPSVTASSGNGDIYFQITGPSSNSWIGLGQGNQMAGANIFMIYADASGTNVTLSPRLGKGNYAPVTNSQAQVSLLDGSGISNGMMTANVRCSNCASWSGGSMSLTSSSSPWIWGANSGSAIKSDSTTADLAMHNAYGQFKLDLTKAQGGSSLNPFTTSDATASSSSSASSPSSASGASSSPTSSSSPDNQGNGDSSGGESAGSADTITTAHGVIMGIAFLGLFPLGAIMIRLLSFPGLVYVHAAIQTLSLLLAIVGLGLGVWLARTTHNLNQAHTIIGIIVVVLLISQPILGVIHHLLFRRYHRRTFWSHVHINLGRVLVTLGMINGGLGLNLAGQETGKYAGYGVVAAIVWLIWIGVVVWTGMRGNRNAGNYRRGKDESYDMGSGEGNGIMGGNKHFPSSRTTPVDSTEQFSRNRL